MYTQKNLVEVIYYTKNNKELVSKAKYENSKVVIMVKRSKSLKENIIKKSLLEIQTNPVKSSVSDGGKPNIYMGVSNSSPCSPLVQILKIKNEYSYQLEAIFEDSRSQPVVVVGNVLSKFLAKKKLDKANFGNSACCNRSKSTYLSYDSWVYNSLGRKLVLGFDTEWSYLDNSGERKILSYQFHTVIDEIRYDFIFYSLTGMLSLGYMVTWITRDFFQGYGFYNSHPKKESHKLPFYSSINIVLVGHYIGVDLTMLEDWNKILEYRGFSNRQIEALDKIYVQLYDLSKNKPDPQLKNTYKYYVDYFKKFPNSDASKLLNRAGKILKSPAHESPVIVQGKMKVATTQPRIINYFQGGSRTEIRLEIRDTMFLSSEKNSLQSLGESLGVDKVELNKLEEVNGYEKYYYKSHMDELLIDYPEVFEDYAIRDAEIAYEWYEMFVREYGDHITVSSASASLARKIFNDIHPEKSFNHDVTGWKYDNNKQPDYGSIFASRGMIGELANKAYIGGRNEAYTHGLHFNISWDLDLVSAYPLAMASMAMPDYKKEVTIFRAGRKLVLEDFEHPLMFGFGYVNFVFPKDTAFPCIPVPVGDTPVYSLSGKDVIACAPDIYAAVLMGADVRVSENKVFYLVPCKHEEDGSFSVHYIGEVVERMISKRYENRQLHGKGSAQELLSKLICNGLYGKTGQGVKCKKSRDFLSNEMINTPFSKITDGAIASTVTASVRALLSLCMHYINRCGYTVYSATTDGFITNFPPEKISEIDSYLKSISETWSNALNRIDWGRDREGNKIRKDSILEVKHVNRDGFFNIKTRGNIGFGEKVDESVFAKAGYRGDISFRAYDLKTQKIILLMNILNRKGPVEDKLSSMKSLYDLRRELNTKVISTFEEARKEIRLDFDSKRFLLSHNESTGLIIIGDEIFFSNYGYFNSRPFNSPEEYIEYSRTWDAYTSFGHNIKNDIDYFAWELARLNGFPLQRPGKITEEMTFNERNALKQKILEYQIGQFMRLKHVFLNEATLIVDIPKIINLPKKETINLLNKIVSMDVESSWKNALKLKKQYLNGKKVRFDLYSALVIVDRLNELII